MDKCNLCKRNLDNPEDPLSENIGGNCIYCMIREEVDIKDYQAARMLTTRLSKILSEFITG